MEEGFQSKAQELYKPGRLNYLGYHYRRLLSTELCCRVLWPGAAASQSEGINPGLALALYPLVSLPLNLIVTQK